MLLAGAAYLALGLRPVATPLGELAAPRLSGSPVEAPLVALAVGTLVAAAFGLAPDADKAGSRAARAGGRPTRLAAWLLQVVLGHRGLLHSGVALLLVWRLAEELGRALTVSGLGAVVAFGWGMHVLLDACTPAGVPLLWPLGGRVRLPPGIVTGGLIEQGVVLAALLCCAAWVTGATWPG